MKMRVDEYHETSGVAADEMEMELTKQSTRVFLPPSYLPSLWRNPSSNVAGFLLPEFVQKTGAKFGLYSLGFDFSQMQTNE